MILIAHTDQRFCRRLPTRRDWRTLTGMPQTLAQTTDTVDVFPVQGVDHLQFLVGNAKQAAHYSSTAFGMTCVAYRGPELGFRDHAEYVLVSGSARVPITRAGHPGAP